MKAKLRQFVAHIPGARAAWRLFLRTVARLRPSRPPQPEELVALLREIAGLRRRNRFSRATLVDLRSGAVVTMTSHGERLREAWIALESIGRGDVLPARLMLWIDEQASFDNLPRELKRMRRRGLEVLLAKDRYGVHTKYYPYLSSVAVPEAALVTSDDDIIYPKHWLSALVAAHSSAPRDVVCFRAHVIGMEPDGTFVPYMSWQPAYDQSSSFAHFGTSVSGQLLPADLQTAIRERGEQFRDVAPLADDVWLSACAVAAGFKTRMVESVPRLFPWIPGSQETGLFVVNTLQGGNDVAIDVTFDAALRKVIAGDIREHTAPPSK